MENNIRVIILTEAGENIGFGHLMRCFSIFQAFDEKQIATKFVINYKGQLNNLNLPLNSEFNDWITNIDQILNSLTKSDIVIIDSYIADKKIYDKISNTVSVCAYIDDYKRLIYPKGIVINGAVNSEKLNYPIVNDIKYLLGKEFQPFRKAFWKIESRIIKSDIENILITVGAIDSFNLIPTLSNLLNEILPNVEINVLVSKSSPNYNELLEKQNSKFNVLSELDEISVKELMLNSDLAICAGGQTLYECVATRLPTMAIIVAENQSNNVHGLKAKELIHYAGKWKSQNLKLKIKSLLKNEFTFQKRKDICEKIQNDIDTNGSKRIIKEILKSYIEINLTIRLAKVEDAIDVYNLANDEVVRVNSFNQEKIIFENHLNWFNKNLVDQKTLFLIIEVNNLFSGQIRYDINNNEATINISIVSFFRGFSLGEIAIIKSIAVLKHKYHYITRINAFVKKSNIPSQIVFKKSNFSIEESYNEIDSSFKYVIKL